MGWGNVEMAERNSPEHQMYGREYPARTTARRSLVRHRPQAGCGIVVDYRPLQVVS
jgi:hypothetical protein